MCKVSVIVTVYNDACYLPQALDSINNQTVKPYEVIVVDDGSEDDFAYDYVSKHNFDFPVHTYKKSNGGASDARNYGLKKVVGDYVCFLDVDDSWVEDNLYCKLSQMENLPVTYFGCYGGFLTDPESYNSSFRHIKGKVNTNSIGKLSGFPGGAPMYLFRKDALDAIDGFDQTLKQNEDFDLILRLIQAGFDIAGDNSFGYIRNIRDGSLTRNKNYKKSYSNTAAFLDKAECHGYFSQDELSNRRMLNALSCLKRCFFEIKDFRFQKKMLDEVFANIDYVRIKYYPLFFYRIFLSFFL